MDDLTKDFLSGTRWAFSLDGLPNLKILSLGDFSHEGWWAEYNMLLCKDESLQEQKGFKFRTLADQDTYYGGLG